VRRERSRAQLLRIRRRKVLGVSWCRPSVQMTSTRSEINHAIALKASAPGVLRLSRSYCTSTCTVQIALYSTFRCHLLYSLYHQSQDPRNLQRKDHSCGPYHPDKVATTCPRRGHLVPMPSRGNCNTPVRPGILHSQRVQGACTLRLPCGIEQAVERVDALLRRDSARFARLTRSAE
jgi:hypothetical protein